MRDFTRTAVDLASQVGIVTGATGGLGSAISRTLAASGMTVVLVGRNVATLESLVHDIEATGGRAVAAAADVTDAARAVQIVDEVEQKTLADGAGDALSGRFLTLGDDLRALSAPARSHRSTDTLVLRLTT